MFKQTFEPQKVGGGGPNLNFGGWGDQNKVQDFIPESSGFFTLTIKSYHPQKTYKHVFKSHHLKHQIRKITPMGMRRT